MCGVGQRLRRLIPAKGKPVLADHGFGEGLLETSGFGLLWTRSWRALTWQHPFPVSSHFQ